MQKDMPVRLDPYFMQWISKINEFFLQSGGIWIKIRKNGLKILPFFDMYVFDIESMYQEAF